MPLGRVSIKSKPLPSAVFEEVVNLIVAERNTTQLLSLRKFDGRLNVSESQGEFGNLIHQLQCDIYTLFTLKLSRVPGPILPSIISD